MTWRGRLPPGRFLLGGLRPGAVRPAALQHASRPPEHRYPTAAVQTVRCPHCALDLAVTDGSFVCGQGHGFDIARQGYVALLGPKARTDTGDSSDMVAARAEFLAAGHYRPIAAAVTRAALADGTVLEIGAGTGYYLDAVLRASPGDRAGVALDTSKFAVRRTADLSSVLSVLADAWSPLPIRDAAVGVVLSVFAPRDLAEICRVLQPGGLLVAVTPDPDHLAELREQVEMLAIDEGKADRLADALAGKLQQVGRTEVRFSMDLDRPAMSALIRMGPSARHLTAAEPATQLERVPTPSTVTGAVSVSVFRRD